MRKIPKDLALGDLDYTANDGLPPRRRPRSISEVNMMRRASKSFENLIALANDQERLGTVSKVARQAVWRDIGELPVQLDTLSECLEHASRGGLREFFLFATFLAHGVLPGCLESMASSELLIYYHYCAISLIASSSLCFHRY
jgi:hypothetical protein